MGSARLLRRGLALIHQSSFKQTENYSPAEVILSILYGASSQQSGTLHRFFDAEKNSIYPLMQLYHSAFYRLSYLEATVFLLNTKRYLNTALFLELAYSPLMSLNHLSKLFDVHNNCTWYHDETLSFRSLKFIKYQSLDLEESASLFNIESPKHSIALQPYILETSQPHRHNGKILHLKPVVPLIPAIPKVIIRDALAYRGFDNTYYVPSRIGQALYNIMVVTFSLDDLTNISTRRQDYELIIVRVQMSYVALLIQVLPEYSVIKDQYVLIGSPTNTVILDQSVVKHFVITQQTNVFGYNDEAHQSKWEVLGHR